MFNEGDKCIVEYVADGGSQVWFKTRVDRVEPGLVIVELVGGKCDATVWLPNMDGAWNIDAEGTYQGDRFRIWSKDSEEARAGLAASKLFARLREALGPFKSAVHRAGATIDVLAAEHADELKARIRKVEVMAEALNAELEDMLSHLTYPAKTNDSKMTRRQVAQYLVGQRVQFDRAGWTCTVEDVARLSGLPLRDVERFEAWAVLRGTDACGCITSDVFMRAYAEQVGGVEMLDRIAR